MGGRAFKESVVMNSKEYDEILVKSRQEFSKFFGGMFAIGSTNIDKESYNDIDFLVHYYDYDRSIRQIELKYPLIQHAIDRVSILFDGKYQIDVMSAMNIYYSSWYYNANTENYKVAHRNLLREAIVKTISIQYKGDFRNRFHIDPFYGLVCLYQSKPTNPNGRWKTLNRTTISQNESFIEQYMGVECITSEETYSFEKLFSVITDPLYPYHFATKEIIQEAVSLITSAKLEVPHELIDYLNKGNPVNTAGE